MFLKRIKKGFSKGYNTPTLPLKIINFHNNPIIRLLRVIGGISIIFTLGKYNLDINIPMYIYYLNILISIIYLIYMLIINVLKIIHIVKLIRSKELEVKNSPLDKLATLTARVIVCAKGLCSAGATGGSVLGLGLGLDAALTNSGNDPIFSPYFVEILKIILPEGLIKSNNIGIDNKGIKESLSKLSQNQKEQIGIQEFQENTLKNAKELTKEEKWELNNLAEKHKQDFLVQG